MISTATRIITNINSNNKFTSNNIIGCGNSTVDLFIWNEQQNILKLWHCSDFLWWEVIIIYNQNNIILRPIDLAAVITDPFQVSVDPSNVQVTSN